MKLNIVAIVFGCIWFGGLLMFLIGTLLAGRFSPGTAGVPLLMLLFGVVLFVVPFLVEANISKKDLERIFECEAQQG